MSSSTCGCLRAQATTRRCRTTWNGESDRTWMWDVGCGMWEEPFHSGTTSSGASTRVAMRVPRLLAFVAALTALACEPVVEEDQTVELTLRLKLGQGYDIGATPGRVFIYADSVTVNRAIAFPYLAAEVCVLATTPVTTCTVTVPRLSTVSLVAAEPDGAVLVRFTPEVPQDTVRDGRYVEFTGWTECDDRAER